MLSDSIYESINNILGAVDRYSKPPFQYGTEYRKEIIESVANLYYIAFSLDGVPKSINECRKYAEECYDLAIYALIC